MRFASRFKTRAFPVQESGLLSSSIRFDNGPNRDQTWCFFHAHRHHERCPLSQSVWQQAFLGHASAPSRMSSSLPGAESPRLPGRIIYFSGQSWRVTSSGRKLLVPMESLWASPSWSSWDSRDKESNCSLWHQLQKSGCTDRSDTAQLKQCHQYSQTKDLWVFLR